MEKGHVLVCLSIPYPIVRWLDPLCPQWTPTPSEHHQRYTDILLHLNISLSFFLSSRFCFHQDDNYNQPGTNNRQIKRAWHSIYCLQSFISAKLITIILLGMVQRVEHCWSLIITCNIMQLSWWQLILHFGCIFLRLQSYHNKVVTLSVWMLSLASITFWTVKVLAFFSIYLMQIYLNVCVWSALRRRAKLFSRKNGSALEWYMYME